MFLRVFEGGVAVVQQTLLFFLELSFLFSQLRLTACQLGLALLRAWLAGEEVPVARQAGAASALTRRVIPCLDVRNGRVTKGVKFKNNVDLGDPVEMAVRYSDGGADASRRGDDIWS